MPKSSKKNGKGNGGGKLIKMTPRGPDRGQPNSQQSEASLLGGCFADAACIARISPIVETTDFYHPTHAAIYQAMLDLSGARKPIDTLTVAEQLRANDDYTKLKAFNGEAYFGVLMEACVGIANIEWHAKIVRAKSSQRHLIATAQEIAAKGYADYDDPDQYLAEAEKSVAMVVSRRDENAVGVSPATIIDGWRDEGPLHRYATGITALDDACRGGLPVPWRVALVGAPSAGKTMLQIITAQSLAEAGITVGLLGVDEDAEDLTVRLAQIAGFTVAQAELRDHQQLAEMRIALARLPIRLYPASCSIEKAGADLARWAAIRGSKAALFVDSVQTAHADCGSGLETERAIVAANIAAIRSVSDDHRMLVIFTSEANRNSYRSDDAEDSTNDLAAGAESRAIEYGAQTLLMLRTPKDHPDVVRVKIAKNRRAISGGEFFLKIDRDRHALSACPDPVNSPESAVERDTKKTASNRAQVERDAKELLTIARNHPGSGTRELKDFFKAAGRGGNERFRGALAVLLHEGLGGVRLADRSDSGRGNHKSWILENVGAENAHGN
jgi:replicative DNA helicase